MSDATTQKGNTILLAVSGAIALISFIAVSWALANQGHAAFNMNQNVAWGLPIQTYVYLALMSSGLTLFAGLTSLFSYKPFYPLVKRAVWLAIATLVGGLITLAVELPGVFTMMWAMPANMQIESAMFWMGVFYAIDLVFLAWKFQKLEANDWDSSTSRGLNLASVIAVLLAAGTLALIFGMMNMRPFWFDGLLPVWFYLIAALSGVAALIFCTYLSSNFDAERMPHAVRQSLEGPLPRLFALLLAATVVFFLGRMITGLYSNHPEVHNVWADYLMGSTWFHIGVWGGLLLPLVLMGVKGLRRSPGGQIAAAALVLVGVFIERYFFIVAGQVAPLWKGTWFRGFDAYVPSGWEWMLTIMGVALVFALYALGERLFRLNAGPEWQSEPPAVSRDKAGESA